MTRPRQTNSVARSGATLAALAVACIVVVAGCGSDDSSTSSAHDAGAGFDASSGFDAGGGVDSGASSDGGSRDGGANDAGADASTQSLVARLIALTANCTVASNGKYATDQGAAATIDICRLNGAFFWKADMDIDCDGQQTTHCNLAADPAYQNQTSFNQSNNQPLNAETLPYVVIPLPSTRFSYSASNIKPGAVVAVIYGGKLTFGVFGDEGPSGIIGEASYAMAKSLGIDPNPSTGGVDTGVTYIAFTGAGAVAVPIEDHQAADTLGQSLATTLLQNN